MLFSHAFLSLFLVICVVEDLSEEEEAPVGRGGRIVLFFLRVVFEDEEEEDKDEDEAEDEDDEEDEDEDKDPRTGLVTGEGGGGVIFDSMALRSLRPFCNKELQALTKTKFLMLGDVMTQARW